VLCITTAQGALPELLQPIWHRLIRLHAARLALASLALVLAQATAPAVLADAPSAVMRADAPAPAVLAGAPSAVMRADARAPTVLTPDP